jgi:hypothetical protein
MARRSMLLALLLCIVAPRARADKAGEALQLLDKGIAAFNAGQLPQARELFSRARDLVPDKANPYRWLGLVDARMGHCADAARELDIFLQKVPPGDARTAEALTLRDRCRQELAPRVGTLVVETTPPGAEVRLDDPDAAEVGVTPYRNEAVPVGSHVLFVRKPGYEALTRGVSLPQNEVVLVELPLHATSSAAAPRERPARATAPAAAALTRSAPPPPPPRKSRAWIAGVVVGVVAAAGLGLGLGLGLTLGQSSVTTFDPIRAPGAR